MKAPASTKGRERHDQILDAAAATLTEAGYADFSLRKVADRLAIRLSNLQYYFPTLAELLSALFTRELDRARERFEASDSQDLDTLLAMLLDEQDGGSCRLFWELWALSARNRDIAEIMAGFYERYSAAVETLIAQTRPEMRPAHRRRRAVIITAMIEGLSLFRGDGRSPPGGDAALRREVLACARVLAAADT